MIGEALQFLVDELNGRLQRRYGQQRNLIVLGPLVAPDGHPNSLSASALVLTVAKISQETVTRNQPLTQVSQGYALHTQRALELNVQLLFAAGLSRYDIGLALLSVVIEHLYESPVFDRESAPNLPPGVLRLALAMVNIDYAQQSHLWGGLGAKYMPSALYEMRMLTTGDAALAAAGSLVATLGAQGTAS